VKSARHSFFAGPRLALNDDGQIIVYPTGGFHDGMHGPATKPTRRDLAELSIVAASHGDDPDPFAAPDNVTVGQLRVGAGNAVYKDAVSALEIPDRNDWSVQPELRVTARYLVPRQNRFAGRIPADDVGSRDRAERSGRKDPTNPRRALAVAGSGGAGRRERVTAVARYIPPAATHLSSAECLSQHHPNVQAS
jgi:hypothetical protein